VFYAHDRIRRHAGPPNLPARRDVALRLVSSAARALPAEIGERFKRHSASTSSTASGSTEMLHIFLSNRPTSALRNHAAWPVPGYEIELARRSGGAVADGEPGRPLNPGPLGPR